ncbi:MAG: PLP-dependent cysteine synthase family protein [FCB group bacterium]|nr:PLP-dependent cysteine synthase family protein [FCB group bacterium]
MSVLDLIGNTPLIDIGSLFDAGPKVTILAKAEWMNPGGSLKDRPVKRMLEEALKSGQLENKVVLDSSSGNAGIAYSMIGNALGLKVKIVLPGNASQERKDRIRAHGATIVETDPLEGYDEAIRYAHQLFEENPDRYFLCNQYQNDNNWKAHYYGTAKELISQADKPITHFIGGVGTGGSITGIGRRLKETYRDVIITAVRPETWPGIEGLKPLGSPGDIVPEIFDEALVDRWVEVTSDEARRWCRKAAGHGFFVGHSSGAYLAGIEKVLKDVSAGVITTLFNDLGERYFSAGLWR